MNADDFLDAGGTTTAPAPGANGSADDFLDAAPLKADDFLDTPSPADTRPLKRTWAVVPPPEKPPVVLPGGDKVFTSIPPDLATVPNPVGPTIQLPPDIQARIDQIIPPQPAVEPPAPAGQLIAEIPPEPSAQQKILRQFSTDTAGRAIQSGAAKAGKGLDLAGRVLAAAIADVGISDTGQGGEEDLNLAQVLKGETPDYERETKFLPKSLQMAESGAYGLVKSAPQMAAAIGAEAIGIPAPLAAAGLFGLTPQGFDPEQGAIGAALPFAGRYGGEISELVAKRFGISSDEALQAVTKIGAASASAGLIGLDQVHSIMQLPPEQRENAWIEAVGNVAGMAGFGLVGAHEPVGTDFRGMTAAQKGAYGGEQLNRLLTGKTPLPEPPGAPALDLTKADDFLQQRPVGDLNTLPQAPAPRPAPAAPPAAVQAPPPDFKLSWDEAEAQGPAAVQAIMTKFGITRDQAVAVQAQNRTRLGITKNIAQPAATPGAPVTIGQKMLADLRDQIQENQVKPPTPATTETASAPPPQVPPAKNEPFQPSPAPAAPAGEALPTAKTVLDKPLDPNLPQTLLALPDEELTKLAQTAQKGQFPMSALATKWAMAHPETDIAGMEALQKQMGQRGPTAAVFAQWYGDAIHALKMDEIGKMNFDTIQQQEPDYFAAAVEKNEQKRGQVKTDQLNQNEQKPGILNQDEQSEHDALEKVQETTGLSKGQQARLSELKAKGTAGAPASLEAAGSVPGPEAGVGGAPGPAGKANLPKPGAPVKPAKVRRTFYLRPRSDGVHDILDDIQELGGIKPPGKNAGGEYDGYKEATKGAAALLRNQTGESVDNLIKGLHEKGYHRIQSADDVWNAVKQASESRDNLRIKGGGPEAQTERFWSAATSPNSKAGLLKIGANDLNVGDKFRLRAPGVSHEELTVTHRDPETGTLQVKDGTSFGVQDLPEGSEIWVDRKHYEANRTAKTKFAAGESDLFGAPESISDQRARMANEQKTRDEKKSKDQMLTKAGARLTGEDIDTTGEMFGGEAQTRADKAGQQSFFAKEEKPGRGITPDQAQRVSDAMTQNFRNAPPTEIHGTPETLPAPIRRAAKQQGVNLDTVKAVYHDGKVHLVASNLDSANEAARKWLHEAAGHQGVETVLGDNANDFLDGVYQAYKDRPMMDDLRRRYSNADNRTLAREVLAHLAEDPTSDPGLWRKVVAKVRAALRAAGVKLSVTDADIQEILRRAVKQIGGTQEKATEFAAGAEKDETRPDWISTTSAAKAVRAARIAYDKTGDRSKSIDAGLNAIVSSAPAKFDEWQARRWFSNEFGKPENFPKEASAAAFAKQKLYDEGMLDSDAADSLNRLPLSKQAVIDVESALWKAGEKRTWKELVADEGDAGHTFEGADESDSFSWAKQHHGLTDDINEAGYVLPNGEMLDFSGKRQGGEAGTRAEDHRQIQFPGRPGDGYEAMRVFMKKGAMRVDANSGNIDLETAPTDSQIRKIQEIGDQNEKLFVDLQDGNRKASISGEDSKKTIGLIRRFYRGEDLPEHQVSFAAGEAEAGFDDLKAAADAANARRGRAYEAINKARDVSNKDVTKEMQDERRAADIEAREANERLRRHPGYIEDTITRYNEALKKLEAAKAVKDPDALALARQAVEDFHHEFEQMPSRTFTQVWNRMQDEGKLPKSAEMPPGRSLSSLTDWLRAHDIESPKMGIIERMRLAARAGEFVKGLRDHASITGTKAKASWEAMKESFIHPPLDTDFRRVIKEWHFADTFTGQETHNWIKAIEAKVPDPRRRAAISVWLEARGDEDEIRAQRADLNGVKNGKRYTGIWDMALKLTPSEKALANSIHADFESKLDDAKNVGMLEKGRENYGVPQLWKVHPQPKEGTGFGDKQRAGNWRAQLDPRDPFFSLQRTVPTYFDGIMAGGEPHSLDVGKLVGVYNEAFHKNLSSRAVIWSLKDAKAADGTPVVKISGSAHFLPLESGKRQLLVDSATRGPDTVTADGRPYRSIDHWALRGWTYKGNTEAGSPVLVKGDFLVHPDHYDFLKNELETPKWMRHLLPGETRSKLEGIGHAGLRASSFLKQSKFIGPFHAVTEALHAATHGAVGLLEGVTTGGSPSVRGFQIDLRDPRQAMLARNMELGFGAQRVMMEEGVSSHGGIWSKVPGLGELILRQNDFIFHEYIPRLKMKVGLAVLNRNMRRYSKDTWEGKALTPEQIAELTGRQMDAAFGGQNNRLLGTNKNTLGVMRLATVAPDFLISRAKVIGQAFKPYNHEQRMFLLAQAAGVYALSRVLNTIFSDNHDPHFEAKNWDAVVIGNRAYRARFIVSDAANLARDLMGFGSFNQHGIPFITGRLGVIPKTGIEAVTGKDLFTGQNKDGLFAAENPALKAFSIVAKDTAEWMTPMMVDGFMPGSEKKGQTGLGSAIGGTVGISSRNESAAGAMWDAAAKFNQNSADPSARLYQKQRDNESRAESAYRGLDNLLLANDLPAAQKEYAALINDGHKPESIAAHYKATNQDGDPARPFTGKQERDKQMLAQQPELRRLYNEAIQERQELEAKFNRLPK